MENEKYGSLGRAPRSFWLTPPEQPGYPALDADIKADIAIVGGGIAGITAAYLLMKERLKPAVLEADKILFGATGHTTAKITSQHELIYDRLISSFGAEMARQYADANESAIKEIRRIVKERQIECDFLEQSAFVFTGEEKNIGKIDKEVKAALGLGIRAEYAERIPFDIPCLAAVRFDGQAQFHPRKYLLALAGEIAEAGCRIYEHTRVVDIEESGSGYILTAGNGRKVSAGKVVIASHYPFLNKPGLYFARLHTQRSYVVAIRAKAPYPGGMYINAEEPARSLRGQPSDIGELTLVGGESHRTGQSPDTLRHYRAIVDFARKHFDVADIPYHWSAQDCMTPDGLPYAGRFTEDTENLYVATGFGKWGMTNATASAMLIRDLIVKERSPWEDVYSPSRFHASASMKNLVVENANVAAKLFEGKLEAIPEEVDVQPGEGKVVEIGGHRAGAYRDWNGGLHLVDTTCPHMGCELNWNTAEHSWDCPCHGSRFDADGSVIEGPASRVLNVGKSVNTVEKIVRDKF
jgi:glycine/D-amino acid oxidase-like deaminating enzyme/nitrite reductase/ring-hydroxylating ferredoxin subunit